MERVILTKFNVESEAFQVFSKVKNDARNPGCVISQAAVVKSEGSSLTVVDHFNAGTNTTDDTIQGGLAGALIGVVAGPIGMLLFGSIGMLGGTIVDSLDAEREVSSIKQVVTDFNEDGTYLVLVADELLPEQYDEKVAGFEQVTSRYDAAEIAVEVEQAAKMERELAKEARRKWREEQKAERKAIAEEKRQELRDAFDEIKGDLMGK